ncbi:MAG TPA: FAD-binding oxidoreductase [Candidatus Limnocylindria bacterium]|nr:FAD-binding oxidoreductase [Candidatus Limnocylindria bacterium]
MVSAAIAELKGRVRGGVIDRDDAAYDGARQVYNAMIDKRPALIARCTDAADVISAIEFARAQKLVVAIRGGGHNGGGLGTVEGGLVIDLSPMRGVRVDPTARLAQVAGGATFGDVDHATHAFGLATPSGIIGTTGVGGLTLGGGMGYLSRKYGLTIDNLVSADVVLGDGRLVTANEHQNDDLFWALRGGGGNFGAVTQFTFRLHPVDTIIGGPMLWPIEQGREILAFYRDFMRDAPEELYGFFAFLTVPPGPPFPEHLHLKKVCGVVWCYVGDPAKADKLLAPARAVAPPALDGVQSMPFPALQSAFDALYPKGHQWYWRADFVDDISPKAIEAHIEYASRLPTMQSTMHLYPIDGAVHRVGEKDTAWSFRKSRWSQVMVGVDPDPKNAEMIRRWTVDYWSALHPYSAGGAYVNFMMDEGQERVQATYRGNYERLAKIKKKYDPDNFFHVNQNIKPGG